VAYIQTLIDNFDDDSLDPVKWTIAQGPGATEASGTLNLACTSGYPKVEGNTRFDLSIGIFAAKLSSTGTPTGACEFYIGVRDASGNYISALGTPNDTTISFQPGGLASFSNEVISDTGVGIGSSWVPGTWWGIGNMGSDSIIKMYNSVDGQTWNEMARCTVGGTFDKTAVSHIFTAGVWDASTPDLIARFDDASYWIKDISTFVTRKVRVGGQWIPATPKVRIGGVWVPASPKPRIGGEWYPMAS